MTPPASTPRLHQRLFFTLLLALSGAAVLWLFWNLRGPLAFEIARIEPAPTSVASLPQRKVTVRLSNLASNTVHFIGEQKVQVRTGGQWQPAETCSTLVDEHLKPGGKREDVVFAAPPRTDACRFTLEYRVGNSPYCKAYFFLQRHGISRRFPQLSKWVLKKYAGVKGLRRATVELPLPSEV